MAVSLVLAVHALVFAQSGTIPEAVAATKHSNPVHLTFIDDPVPLSLENLATRSDLVLVGRLANPKAYLSPNKRTLFTDYEIVPGNVFVDRGSRETAKRPGVVSPLTLTMQGGTMVIDGTSVTLHDSHRMEWSLDDTLLMFLRQVTSGRYVPVGGNAGLFKVDGSERLRSLLRDAGADDEMGELRWLT